MSQTFPSKRLKQSSLNLIPKYGPLGVGEFLPSKQFEVRTRANLLNGFAYRVGFCAVALSSSKEPAALGVIEEGQVTANPEQQELVRDAPVVPHPELRFDPYETGFVGEAPGLDDAEGVR